MNKPPIDIDRLNGSFKSLPLEVSLERIANTFAGKIIKFSSSLGPEDQVITDGIFRGNHAFEVFTLDTGRLHAETYDVLDRTVRQYNRDIQVFYPQHDALQKYVGENGINGFYENQALRKSCCYIRKIEPLNRALAGTDIWLTGIRAAQSDFRQDMQVFEWDQDRQLLKINPLLDWSTEQLWHYINVHDVPYNELHKKGFPSIGCQPCTRAIGLHEHERAGRWWWEDADQKECGLHTTKIEA